ncbi:MAG TPA: DUF4132 domain-containing protein [Thermoanaerobaculia bacterium]|nr:DUF4132 domain-containing protein [Thermoanaerobaculia bacterium]
MAELAAGRALLELELAAQPGLALFALRLLGDRRALERLFQPKGYPILERHVLSDLATRLLRRTLPWTDENLTQLVEVVMPGEGKLWDLPRAAVASLLEGRWEKGDPPGALVSAVRRWAGAYPEDPLLVTAADRRLRTRLEALLARGGGPAPPPPLLLGRDAWSLALRKAIDGAEPVAAAAWQRLLVHCATARSAEPSQRWLGEARGRVESLGSEPFRAATVAALEAVGQPGEVAPLSPQAFHEATLLDERDTDLLRGLIWTAGLEPREELIAAVGRAAEAAFRKVPGHGPRNAKVGHACLQALSRMDCLPAVAELDRLRPRIKHPSARARLEKALARAAERQGKTRDDLAELATPTLGFTEVGRKTQELAGFTAELMVEGRRVAVSWCAPDGKTQSSPPKAVRESAADELVALKRTGDEVQRLLPALADRLERLYVHPRDWEATVWRQRYADHPLMGTLARRFIWRLGEPAEGRLIAWWEGAWSDVEGTPVSLLAGERVGLWHPLESPAATVRAWRILLETRAIVQPFKQAHREIYLLTEAERTTGTYSNRFAAHILRQHQLAALARERGWGYRLQGQFDSSNWPTLVLPEHATTVEYGVEPAGDELSAAQIFLYVSTDQVRFLDAAGEPRPLETVPPLLFSEVMRDVDLFVGVASIGSDPGWVDGGAEAFQPYWQAAAFGELGALGQGRKELVERLLPRLAIADRCEVQGRFLRVRGQRGRYKIHLGSGNVLMEPNDRYLCIVPDGSKGLKSSPLRLPFEGDARLGVILSKAFLLAADDRIRDPTILRQLPSGGN